MISPTSPACLRIRAYLAEHPGSTYRQIAAGAHVAESAVKNQYLPLLRRAGLIHITGYLPTKGLALRLYAAGPQLVPVVPLLQNIAYQRKRVRDWKRSSGHDEHHKALRRLARPEPILAAFLGINR